MIDARAGNFDGPLLDPHPVIPHRKSVPPRMETLDSESALTARDVVEPSWSDHDPSGHFRMNVAEHNKVTDRRERMRSALMLRISP